MSTAYQLFQSHRLGTDYLLDFGADRCFDPDGYLAALSTELRKSYPNLFWEFDTSTMWAEEESNQALGDVRDSYDVDDIMDIIDQAREKLWLDFAEEV